MSEPDIVFLFGAGASHGAVGVLPKPPPLGKDLYDALAMQYPDEWGAKSHLNIWADKFRQDFEQTMFDEVLTRIPFRLKSTAAEKSTGDLAGPSESATH